MTSKGLVLYSGMLGHLIETDGDSGEQKQEPERESERVSEREPNKGGYDLELKMWLESKESLPNSRKPSV